MSSLRRVSLLAADRIIDARCKVVVTANEGLRGGKRVPLKKTVDRAVEGMALVDAVLDRIRRSSCRRKRVVAMTGPVAPALGTEFPVTPMEIELGGATVFVWDVERAETY